MADVKFTSGPWRVFTTKDGSKLVGVGEQTGEGITDCGFGMWGGGDAEALANAHLIAASPDLYEALKEARIALNGGPITEGLCHQVDAALAKAEGQS